MQKKPNTFDESATGDGLQTCCCSNANISPQKVTECGQTSENIDRGNNRTHSEVT